MTASELLVAISPAFSQRIVEEVHATDRDLYRLALAAAAQFRKVRPVFLERQPRTDQHRAVLAALTRPEFTNIAGNVLSGWLVKNQAGLLKDFLDALKIPHQNGVVENLPEQVEDDVLNGAITLLLEKHQREVVALYLRAFHDMNDAHWPNLQKLLAEDPRLTLAA